MTARPVGAPDRPVDYAIRFEGRLGPRRAAWFAGMTLTDHEDGTTTLRGLIPDQAALHGILAGLRDLGVPLISVVPATSAGTPAPIHRRALT